MEAAHWPVSMVAMRCALLITGLAFIGCADKRSRTADPAEPPDAAPPDAAPPDAAPPDAALMDAEVDATPDAGAPDWTLPAELLPPLASSCPNQRGMIGVPFPNGDCYLMDPWPVTRGAYHAAQASGPLRSAHSACEGHEWTGPPTRSVIPAANVYCNLNFRGCTESDDECEQIDLRMPWPPSDDEANEPMVCVTWCDAEAYCAAVGKRLCGNTRLESDSEYSPEALSDVQSDELFNACFGGGNPRFPRGLRTGLFAGPHEPLSVEKISIEGAWAGLFGLAVTYEWRGPIPWSSIGNNEAPELSCLAPEVSYWQRIINLSRRQLAYSGAISFRCCADIE